MTFASTEVEALTFLELKVESVLKEFQTFIKPASIEKGATANTVQPVDQSSFIQGDITFAFETIDHTYLKVSLDQRGFQVMAQVFYNEGSREKSQRSMRIEIKIREIGYL